MTAANCFPWTLTARHELVAVNEAMREAVAERGLALALTTNAGRAWLKLGSKDAALSYVKPTHATVGCWPDALAVPDDAADALARVAVHIDAGLGRSLLAMMPNDGGVPFGVPAGALTAAGCPTPLAAATALWSFAMTNAARHLISRANAVSARREHVDEIDLMVVARGRAHLEFGLSPAGGPAIAAAVWCAPVELSELWHLLADIMEPEQGKARARLVADRRAALDRLARDAAAWARDAWTAGARRMCAAPPVGNAGGFGALAGPPPVL
jgi:hypothetical protein